MIDSIIAYILWGLLPFYWKFLERIPPDQILCHRTVWSLVFMLLLLAFQKHWLWLKKAFSNRKILLTFFISSIILSLNWFMYIWAVNNNFIVEASLGYFINPLFSVLLGVIFLKERLRFWQWFAIALAAAGILYMTAKYGSFPWIALTLAISFGTYGLMRKTAPLNSTEGLALELTFLFLPALIYLLFLAKNGSGAFGHASLIENMLLVLAGAVTALPLLLFASGARKINLSTVGLLQYITPSLQFLIGIYVYHEHFNTARLVGFAIIWSALLIYVLEGFWTNTRASIKIPD
jgi:chloramphenicol-sensitive protein RarD